MRFYQALSALPFNIDIYYYIMNVPTLRMFLRPIFTVTTTQNTGETGDIHSIFNEILLVHKKSIKNKHLIKKTRFKKLDLFQSNLTLNTGFSDVGKKSTCVKL